MLNEFLVWITYSLLSSLLSALKFRAIMQLLKPKGKLHACCGWILISLISHGDRIMHSIRTYPLAPSKKPRLYVSAVSCTKKA